MGEHNDDWYWGDATHEELAQPVNIAIHNEGLFALHNLQCWFCRERSAVFDMSPNWCFLPCWECQKRYVGIWTKKPTRWQRLKDRFLAMREKWARLDHEAGYY